LLLQAGHECQVEEEKKIQVMSKGGGKIGGKQAWKYGFLFTLYVLFFRVSKMIFLHA